MNGFEKRLKEMMTDSESLTKPVERSTPPQMSGQEIVARAGRYAALASNGRVAERQSRLDYDRKQQAAQTDASETDKPKRKSREEVAEELRSWLTELTPSQRAAFAYGNQYDRLSPGVKEVASEVLGEFELEEPEPVADFLFADADEEEDEWA